MLHQSLHSEGGCLLSGEIDVELSQETDVFWESSTPLTFMMSISDINSCCHVLNLDVVAHIFQFIY